MSALNEMITRGRIHLELGKNEDAIVYFDLALEIDPENALAWAGKGIAFVNLGMYDEALECFDKAISHDAELAFAWEG
ncbi:MAG: tetratricopeptide repeat protein, partial [Candidatus Methanosuratincola sp.]